MIPELRRHFNSNYTGAKYQNFLTQLERRCATPIAFRNCETPCFFPQRLLDKIAHCGEQLVLHLVNNAEYLAAADRSIPPQFRASGNSPNPLFVQADFGLVRDHAGELQPKLVEIQGFPSLYAYQPVLAETYRDAYGLDASLRHTFHDLDGPKYSELLCRAIVAHHDPENVILLEIDPWQQKTLPDFLLTERMCGIATVAVTAVKQQGNRLFYEKGGRAIPIHRIYNRVIADELVRKNIQLPFDLRDDLQLEWAGHPNWFYRISKFSLPWLRNESVPKSWFLDQLNDIPADLENYVLKPLYSFAGAGVLIGPTRADLDAIPREHRPRYILQERMQFEPVIDTPFGATKAEIRIMYVWLERLVAATTIIRMGRGKMMGVDQNRDMEWVGASAAFYPPEL